MRLDLAWQQKEIIMSPPLQKEVTKSYQPQVNRHVRFDHGNSEYWKYTTWMSILIYRTECVATTYKHQKD